MNSNNSIFIPAAKRYVTNHMPCQRPWAPCVCVCVREREREKELTRSGKNRGNQLIMPSENVSGLMPVKRYNNNNNTTYAYIHISQHINVNLDVKGT